MGGILVPKKGGTATGHLPLATSFPASAWTALGERRTGKVVLPIKRYDRYDRANLDAPRARMTAVAGYTTQRLPAAEQSARESVQRQIRHAFDHQPGFLPTNLRDRTY